jgi:hypothetical protein
MLPFWRKLIGALSFSDSFGGDEEDGEKTYKFILRIMKDGKCFNKKLHHVLFDDEVELFTPSDGKQPNRLNLIQKTVTLEPLSPAFENPYGGGGSTLSLIKQPTSSINFNEYMLSFK